MTKTQVPPIHLDQNLKNKLTNLKTHPRVSFREVIESLVTEYEIVKGVQVSSEIVKDAKGTENGIM